MLPMEELHVDEAKRLVEEQARRRHDLGGGGRHESVAQHLIPGRNSLEG